MTEKKQMRNVAVYLGAGNPLMPEFRQAVTDLAVYLAEHRMTLIFGGSNCGMMKLLADTVLRHGGEAVGIFTKCLPEKLIRDDLSGSVISENLAARKAEMLKCADAAIALPGSLGTFDELFDALAQCKLGMVKIPIGVLNINGFFDPLFELLRNSVRAGFTRPDIADLLQSGRTPEELFRNLQSRLQE